MSGSPDPPPPAEASAAPPAADPVSLAPLRKRRKNDKLKNLQPEEIDRLFKAISSPRDRAIFRLAYHAGLRASEVGMLQMRDYDARTDRIFIHRLKGSNSGYHHMTREEARVFRAWIKERGSSPGTIFFSRNGLPISRKTLDDLIKRYGATAGIPRELRHFHALKHTCCVVLLDRGFNIEQVQDWVGHARIQNTQGYAKLTNGRRQEMADQLKEWK